MSKLLFNEFQIKYYKIVVDNKASKNMQYFHFNKESYA